MGGVVSLGTMDSSHVLCFIIYGLRAAIQTNHDALANKGATERKRRSTAKPFYSIPFTNEWMNIYMYDFLSLHCHHPPTSPMHPLVTVVYKKCHYSFFLTYLFMGIGSHAPYLGRALNLK